MLACRDDGKPLLDSPGFRLGKARLPPSLSPSYDSGHDFAIEVGGVRFRFNAVDFAVRVGEAAARLGFVSREALGPGEIDDLVALTAHGAIGRASSPLAAHVADHADSLLGFDGDLVHWLRRLVFRGAWIDQGVVDGWLEPDFQPPGDFRYRSALTGWPLDDDPATADWSSTAYRNTTA
jgi:hypothetical protein